MKFSRMALGVLLFVLVPLNMNAIPEEDELVENEAKFLDAYQTYFLHKVGCYSNVHPVGNIALPLTKDDCGKPPEIMYERFHYAQKLAKKIGLVE